LSEVLGDSADAVERRSDSLLRSRLAENVLQNRSCNREIIRRAWQSQRRQRHAWEQLRTGSSGERDDARAGA
jgi:hypothetical protein